MVQCPKRHIRLSDGQPKFVERQPVQAIPVRLPPAEMALHEAVQEEAATLNLRVEKALKGRPRIDSARRHNLAQARSFLACGATKNAVAA